jgi:hypothetical protein
MNKRPNFFIIGAPKCGTTALSKYLSEHPNVFFCDPKEPHYFADDFDGHKLVRNVALYEKLFEKATAEQNVVGEGSVFYLYSKKALENIKEYNPDSKIIVMLRNPIDLVHSLHQQCLHVFYEDEPIFEKAWKLQELRNQSLHIPALCREPKLLQYSQFGFFSENIEMLNNIFPKSQIKIIVFDEFIRDTKKIYDEVLTFLNLPSHPKTTFERVNEAQGIRNRYLNNIVRVSPIFLYELMIKIRMVPLLSFLPKIIKRIIKKPQTRPTLSDKFRNELKVFYKNDIEKLSKIIDKDLSAWIN